MADSTIHECRLSRNTSYTAQFASKSMPAQVKFTRHNREGETVLFIPVSLIWDLMREKFRERLNQRMEHLFLKDFFL